MEFYLLSVSFLLDTRLRIRSSRATFTNTGTAASWSARNYFYRLHCFHLVRNFLDEKQPKKFRTFPKSVFDRSALIRLTRSFLAIISSWFRMSTCRLRSISRARNVSILSFLNFLYLFVRLPVQVNPSYGHEPQCSDFSSTNRDQTQSPHFYESKNFCKIQQPHYRQGQIMIENLALDSQRKKNRHILSRFSIIIYLYTLLL